MIQTIEQSSTLISPAGLLGGMGIRSVVLSQSVIPAVPGEYYAYSSKFTDEEPLYAFMKCKANKARTISAAENLGREVNLIFLFDSSIRAHVCSVKMAHASGLLGGSADENLFGDTWIAPAEMTAEDFYKIRSQKNVAAMVEICQAECSKREVSLALNPGTIVVTMTDARKYGMFFVKKLASSSIQIDACHILLD